MQFAHAIGWRSDSDFLVVKFHNGLLDDEVRVSLLKFLKRKLRLQTSKTYLNYV